MFLISKLNKAGYFLSSSESLSCRLASARKCKAVGDQLASKWIINFENYILDEVWSQISLSGFISWLCHCLSDWPLHELVSLYFHPSSVADNNSAIIQILSCLKTCSLRATSYHACRSRFSIVRLLTPTFEPARL